MVHTHSWIERSTDSNRSGHLHPDPDEDVQLRHDLRAPEGLVSKNQIDPVGGFKLHQTQWIFMDSFLVNFWNDGQSCRLMARSMGQNWVPNV